MGNVIAICKNKKYQNLAIRMLTISRLYILLVLAFLGIVLLNSIVFMACAFLVLCIVFFRVSKPAKYYIDSITIGQDGIVKIHYYDRQTEHLFESETNVLEIKIESAGIYKSRTKKMTIYDKNRAFVVEQYAVLDWSEFDFRTLIEAMNQTTAKQNM